MELVPGAPIIGSFAADPFDSAVIHAAGWLAGDIDTSLLRSNDAGATWTRVAPIPSVGGLTIDPGDPAHIVVAGSDGVLRSIDGGATWQPLEDGLPGTVNGSVPYSYEAIGSVEFSSDGRTLHAGAYAAVYDYTFCDDCLPRADAPRTTHTVTPRLR